MGFDEGRIELDNPSGTFYTGQTVQGKVIFQQVKFQTFGGMYVKWKGYCNVHWTTEHSRQVEDRTEKYSVNHDAQEVYFENKNYLLGGPTGEFHLQPGHYELPFSFTIPGACPSSFEGPHGHIRYEVKVYVDGANKVDPLHPKTVLLKVQAPVDITTDPECKRPVEVQLNDTYCCCCTSYGGCETTVRMPTGGYCPPHSIPVEVICHNHSNVKIKYIKLAVFKNIVYRAGTSADTKHDTEVIQTVKEGPIPGSTDRDVTLDLLLPAMDVHNVDTCKYIDIDYVFQVAVVPSGCHSATEAMRRIVLSSTPLDNVPTPAPTQLPIQPPPVGFAQTPVPVHYPPPQAYPTSPYPPTNPYLPATAPYPTSPYHP